MEFTLDPAFRKADGVRAVVLLIISVLFAFGAVTGFWLAILPAAFFFVSAVGCGIKWWGRLNFRTTVSHDGIEVQGYRVRRIPWAEVKGFQVVDRERVASVRATRSSMFDSGKKVVNIKVIRYSGRAVELRAPLVTRGLGDSEFDNKVRALREAHAAYRGSLKAAVQG